MGSDPEDQLRAGELLWVLAREGIQLPGVPFVVVIEIGNLLADGIAKGLATQTIAAQIAPLLDGDFKRALLIVRTERARAMSGAEYANAKAAGDYDKEWMDDESACPICRANAAQGAISMTQPFSSGALYPPAHPNCRCALQTVAHQATTEKTLMPPSDRYWYSLSYDDMEKLVKALAADPDLAENFLYQLRFTAEHQHDDIERAGALAKATGADVTVPAFSTTITTRKE